MTYSLTKDDLEHLLGRPLSEYEDANRELYLEIAKEQLESMLGLKLDGSPNTERDYPSRKDYRSLVIDPFSDKSVIVRRNGIYLNCFRVRQNQSYNGTWFNTIEFTKPMKDCVYTVSAVWGFGQNLPRGLQMLWAGLFDLAANTQTSSSSPRMKSETTLSHSVTFDTSTEAFQRFIDENEALIAKYDQNDNGLVDAGSVVHVPLEII